MKFNRAIAGILAVCSVISLSACSGSGTTQESQQQTTASDTSSVDDDIRNPVDVSNISLEVTENDIEPAELSYLGVYDLTVAGDIKPAYKYFQENYDCSIKAKVVGSDAIQPRLTAMIASDESPDLIDYSENVFPLMMSKSMLTPLDDYIDLSSPQWSGLEQYINKYKWGGHNYYYPWNFTASPYFLIYNRGLFSELNLPDPKELYDSGDWDWDALKGILQDFVDSEEGRNGLYGYTATSFFDSTGVPLISIDENGMLESNLVDANIERAANFMQDLKREELTITPTDYINVSKEPIVEGMSAFQAMGTWIITDYSKLMTKDPSLDIFFVPFPRDPQADKYYVTMNAFGYLVPAGAKHVEQATVFINCCRLSKTDEALIETTKESIMKDKEYTEEQYDFLVGFENIAEYNGVVDEPYGMDTESADVLRQMIDNVVFTMGDTELNAKSWTQMREENSGVINAQVEYYNGLITNSNGMAPSDSSEAA